MHQHTKILLKIMHMFLRLFFFYFPDGNFAPFLIFKRTKLFADGVWRAEAHHHANFFLNWSIHCSDIAIF